MDAGIIRCFKAHFCWLSMQRALDHYDEGVTPVNIYNIEQLQVIRLAEQAWDKVTQETVANCWRKSGILPTADTVASANSEDVDSDSPESCVPHVSVNNTAGVPADSALQLVEAALAEVLGGLQEAGVLQKKNMIDIEDFIAMLEEKIVEEATNKEIFEAVQKCGPTSRTEKKMVVMERRR
ncbi:hypothetical protein B0H14DRAFT_3503403 [Mycena olivaceomarginata]|nr:hypothetical protein B0H14DRAFT_3503403 [Mycena olivaceomarginata]